MFNAAHGYLAGGLFACRLAPATNLPLHPLSSVAVNQKSYTAHAQWRVSAWPATKRGISVCFCVAVLDSPVQSFLVDYYFPPVVVKANAHMCLESRLNLAIKTGAVLKSPVCQAWHLLRELTVEAGWLCL